MSERPFSAYQGDQPFLFVSYAHADEDRVYPEIQWLHDQGFNIWYDEGISPGSQWHTQLAESIENTSLFLYFVTPASAVSEHCQREVHYALDQKKPLLAVHLEASVLPSGLSLSLSSIQAIIRSEHTQDDYRSKLLKATSEHIERGVARSTHSQPSTNTVGKAVVLGFAALLLVGMVALLLTRLNFETPPRMEVQKPLPGVRSNWVAVLPFRAASSDSQTEQLARPLSIVRLNLANVDLP